MRILHNVFTVIILLLLSACEKTVLFEVDTQENKLVLNSFVTAQGEAFADVSLSLDPLDEDYPPAVSDASVQLFKNGVLISDYMYDVTSFRYTPLTPLAPPSAGDVFKITASAPGKETITAETTMPSAVSISDVYIVDTVLLESGYIYYDSLGNPIFGDSIPYYKIEIEFTDAPGNDNYNLVTNYTDEYGGVPTCFTTNDPVYTLGDEFDFGSGDAYRTFCDVAYFDDLSFNENKKTLTIYLLLINSVFFPEAKYTITLQHLSPEYYKYITSSSLQSNTNGNPFAQPVSVYSNIEGGFGIFAAYNESAVEIEL